MDEATERAVVLVLNVLLLGGLALNLYARGLPNDNAALLVLLAFLTPAFTVWHILRRRSS